ncbi:MAG: hypothetical protein RH982_05735 [Parvibaculum sp.]
MAGPVKDTDQARQGTTGTGTRYVLAISLGAIVVLFAVTYLLFFGAPNFGLDEAQTGLENRDSNPPYTVPGEETPSWQEPAPVENPAETPAP